MPTTIVRAVRDLLLLVAVADATVDKGDTDAGGLAELREDVADLAREFTCRCENERLHMPALWVDVLDHGKSEGEGLAGAGLGLGDYVFAFEEERDGAGLNGGRGLDIHFG